ncbi:transmembrane protein, putative (macronuclear) [Tetrahymena thermophila SB210]|uniref:Transmembrane protein, putative n=1 Tax=Tetrahymena thermophila (strain SB210) TaxID=312017 RepID=W7XHK4_TETTS|nr:transmembrane protein, putative [Tetrahymena thermophila SB210]EWS72594.1 transmembrane protein, putative [Tetrahymena thermophila SB210]|eukprot:XP_012654877.1 transmembrane protein, putative [Tetrahymena thermophila SB210]
MITFNLNTLLKMFNYIFNVLFIKIYISQLCMRFIQKIFKLNRFQVEFFTFLQVIQYFIFMIISQFFKLNSENEIFLIILQSQIPIYLALFKSFKDSFQVNGSSDSCSNPYFLIELHSQYNFSSNINSQSTNTHQLGQNIFWSISI